jgi:hypothetical protein
VKSSFTLGSKDGGACAKTAAARAWTKGDGLSCDNNDAEEEERGKADDEDDEVDEEDEDEEEHSASRSERESTREINLSGSVDAVQCGEAKKVGTVS